MDPPLLKYVKRKSEWIFFNVDDLVTNMFDPAKVEHIATHGENDYQGTIRALFRIRENGNGNELTITRLLSGVEPHATVAGATSTLEYEPPEWRELVSKL